MNTMISNTAIFSFNPQQDQYQCLYDSVRRLENAVLKIKTHCAESIALFSTGLTDIFSLIKNCKTVGIADDEIMTAISPIRQLMRSDFATRIREWPRGYAGDFETIEYMYFRKNDHEPQSLEWMINEYIYGLPIIEQHRNKVFYQASEIKKAISKNNVAQVAVLACGGAIDLSLIENDIERSNATIYINDQDQDAIDFAMARCRKVGNQFKPLRMNIIHAAKKLAYSGTFDLIVAGGVFDYLSDQIATYLICNCYKLLNKDAKLVFTNIAQDNPFQIGMEYLMNWVLIMRSEQDIYRICEAAGIHQNCVTIKRDDSGLALLVELKPGK